MDLNIAIWTPEKSIFLVSQRIPLSTVLLYRAPPGFFDDTTEPLSPIWWYVVFENSRAQNVEFVDLFTFFFKTSWMIDISIFLESFITL